MTFPHPSLECGDAWKMSDGTEVLIRPIRPEDEEMMVKFHQSLSPQTVYTRYFHTLKLSKRIGHERLYGICHPHPESDFVLVAELAGEDGARRIVGVGRLSKVDDASEGEIALLVCDSCQHRGLGTELLRRLIRLATDAHLTRIFANMLSGNTAMQRLCVAVGMRLSDRIIDGAVEAEMDLSPARA